MNDTAVQNARQRLAEAKRIVVKIGSRVLVQKTGRPDARRIGNLVRQIAMLRGEGREVVVVTSGAIGSGMERLGMRRRPTSLPDLQMAAAVGQSRLMAVYDRLFSAHGCAIGQILLTHDDLKNRSRHLNARSTMLNLLRHGIVPVVNENDVVAVDEIKFGDNDLLASLVALLVQADALILLTTVDGLRAPATGRRTRRVPFLAAVSADALALTSGKGSELSTGGMASKLQSAALVLHAGTVVGIVDGRRPDTILRAARGEDTGTCLAAADRAGGGAVSSRKQWIAFFHRPAGAIVIDDGAREAILQKGRSLLPIGIRDVEGDFPAGSVVHLRTLDGAVIGRGLAEYSSAEVRLIRGRRTDEIPAILGTRAFDEVIHRDNMVLA